MLLNCGSGEDSWESLGLQGDQTSQSIKEINPEYSSEGRCWSWNSNTLATLRADSLEKTDARKDWKRSRVNPLMNRVKGYASSQQNWVYWGVTEGFFTTWTTREASLMVQMVKNLPAMQETWLDSWLRRSPGEGMGDPLQYSWASLVAQMVKNLTAMREMWGGKIPWRRAWQPIPVFLPGEPNGQSSLVGYSPWGRKELDMTEAAKHSTVLMLGKTEGRKRKGQRRMRWLASITNSINRNLSKLWETVKDRRA